MEAEQLWFVMRDQHRGPSSQYMYEHLAAQGRKFNIELQFSGR